MKKLALATAAMPALLGVAAHAQVGKGKAPPAAAGRDEGVTLRLLLFGKGPVRAGPYLFSFGQIAGGRSP
jgi:hypothetical protein